MHFNPHSELDGRHAFLSPSKYHWIRYDEEKLLARFDTHMDAALGSRLHEWAAETIKLGIRQVDNSLTINMYVNDCIGYRMSVEVPLFVSRNAFGTCDAISFGPDPDDPTGPPILRIFDLKNGVSATSEDQLNIYAAYFCIEYKIRPGEIKYDLRIYQNDDIAYFDTNPEDIAYIMDWTKTADAIIESRREVL